MIELDGKKGGGQLLRTALGLSARTGKPFRISDIRASRPNPGIQAQHLVSIRIMQKICNGYCEGDAIGSTELMFIPRTLTWKKIDEDIGTAGSINLVLQSLLIPYISTPKAITITLTGGTDVRWSPSSDYYRIVVLQYLRRLCSIEYSIKRRGFYPKGGGIVEVKLRPSSVTKEMRLRGPVSAELVHGIAFSDKSLERANVSERMAMGARRELSGYDVRIQKEYADADSTGAGIALWALMSAKEETFFIGADNLGEKGIPAEEVGKRCALLLQKEIGSGAPIDSHCADNLIPYLGIFGGEVEVSDISDHTRSNIEVTQSFIEERFRISGNIISLDKSDQKLPGSPI